MIPQGETMNRAFKILSFQAAALVTGGLMMTTVSVVLVKPLVT